MKSSKQLKSVRKTERKMRRAVDRSVDFVAELAERRHIGNELANTIYNLTNPDYGLGEVTRERMKALCRRWGDIKHFRLIV